MQDNDQRDRELLGVLQGEIPLVSTPFAVLGQLIDMSEKEVIKRTERLKRDGIVKQIAAQFDTRSVGYRSCLVAARVRPEHIDEAANVVSAHPGVSQNYKRNNDFNLWFTIAVSPSSKLGLEKTVDILGEEAECETIRLLPTLKLYKGAGSESSDSHSGEEKRFLQGLIQLAAAYHHAGRGTNRGGIRLFDAALEKLAPDADG